MTAVTQAFDLLEGAWALIDRNVALSQAVRSKARALSVNALAFEGAAYVQVRRSDLEALKAALDSEDVVLAGVSAEKAAAQLPANAMGFRGSTVSAN